MMGEFVGGLLNGLATGQEESLQKQLKKQMLDEAKIKTERMATDMQMMKRLQENPSDLMAQVWLSGGDPKKVMMAQGLNQLTEAMKPGPSVPLPSPASIGGTGNGLMPQPEQPGATFSMGMINPTAEDAWNKVPWQTRDILRKEMGLGVGQELMGRQVEVMGQDGKLYYLPYTKEGFAYNQMVEAPPKVGWQPGADASGFPIKVPVTQQGLTPQGIAPIRQPIEQPYVSGTGPGGQPLQIPVPKYATQAPPITVTIDPNAPDAEATLQAALAQVKTQKGLGTPRGAIQTAPSPSDLPIKEDDLVSWRHPDTLVPPPLGVTPKQAEAQGYRRLSTQATANIDAIKSIDPILQRVKELATKVFGPSDMSGKKSAIGQRTIGAGLRTIGAYTQLDPDAAELMSVINGTLAPTVRGLGEKGNLSDTDIKRAQGLFPSMTDTPDVAWRKLNGLIGVFGEIQKRQITGLPSPSLSVGKPQRKPLEAFQR